ncbi:MAG: VWA domain-containing protein [Armatimonadia bacterium]
MTNYFRWNNPELLIWLWLAPVVLLLGWRAIRLRIAAARRFCPELGDERLSLRPLWERLYLKTILIALALLLLVIALARPQVGLHRERAQRKGADIIIVVDTSLSMQAQDMQPNRLEAAKLAAANLVNRLPNDRFGIVVFSGDAHLYCPITVDHDAVQMFIDSLTTQSSPQPGTALSEAMKAAGSALANSESKHRAIVLLSDGEDHVSDTLDVAGKVVRETAARVEVLGFGSLEGEPIPVIDEGGNVQGFKQDEKGQQVLSKLGEDELRKLATIGKGMYYRAMDRGAADQLASRLEAMEGSQVGTMLYTDYGERFQWPLTIALVLLALEWLLPERTRRRTEDA